MHMALYKSIIIMIIMIIIIIHFIEALFTGIFSHNNLQ